MPPWSIVLSRLVIILATGLAAVLLVNRWRARRLTCWVTTSILLLSVVPTLLQVVQVTAGSRVGALNLLGGLGEPGFVFLLLAVLLGLRSVSCTTDHLRQQNRRLQTDASIDFLTGLPNRRQLQTLLDYGAARASRSGEPLVFIMMDLDHFKEVNDAHGHKAGDAVLAHVGSILRDRLRGSDIMARYGGEEFLMVVEGKGALGLAECIRSKIEQDPVEFGGSKVPITASFGVAITHVYDGKAVEEGIKRSDAAMYMAKSLGRNRVVRWEQICLEPGGSANTVSPEPAKEPLTAGRVK